jgi:aminopeptidase N
LVVDLWFSLQAQSPVTTLKDLATLEQHAKFDLKNPNRVRSIYSAFGMYNHKRLHAADGSGYQYLAEAVGRLDRLNPQLAARIATPLTRWQRYDEPRQALMRSNLEHLVSAASISKDLYEIVSKSLV